MPAGVMPITGIGGVTVGDGRPGPVTMELVDQLQAMMADPANGLPIATPPEQLREAMGEPSGAQTR